MKPYTVILLYPDYATSNFPHDTYLTFVEADDPSSAIEKARDECMWRDEGIADAFDLFVIAVLEGRHQDVNLGRSG